MIDERRTNTLDNLMMKLGEHEGRLTTLEANIIQQQQSNVNLRAELTGNFQRHEERVENWLKEIKDEILKPLLSRVGRMERFMYILGAGGAAILGFVKFGKDIIVVLTGSSQ